MLSAQEPPELPPIVARPSGSLGQLHVVSGFSTSGTHFGLDDSAYRPDMVSYSRPRWLPCASPLPLAKGNGDHGGQRLSAIRLSRTVNKGRVGSVGSDDEGRRSAGNVLLRHIDGDSAHIGRRDGWW